MKKINEFSSLIKKVNLSGKRVFIRADLNVPFDDNGIISDDTRIKASIPCIRMALESGAAVMVTSHLGRPKEGIATQSDSLIKVAQRLSELLGTQVELIKNWLNGVKVSAGQIVLLENCRFNVGEKNNDEVLSKRMAALCDVYVNDAFGTSHRKEATTYGIASFANVVCAGPLLSSELKALENALEKPKHPLVAIVGGSKVSTKLSILHSLSNKVDELIVGGGIANTFVQASGYRIGKSLAEPSLIGESLKIIESMKNRSANIPIPIDVVCSKDCTYNSIAEIKYIKNIETNDMILDFGPESLNKLIDLIKGANTILWNGPLGVFEYDQFSQGTRAIAEAIANSTAFSIAGGGDTLAAIHKYNISDKIDYVSTGGGAFLEFLEGKELPAVKILEERST